MPGKLFAQPPHEIYTFLNLQINIMYSLSKDMKILQEKENISGLTRLDIAAPEKNIKNIVLVSLYYFSRVPIISNYVQARVHCVTAYLLISCRSGILIAIIERLMVTKRDRASEPRSFFAIINRISIECPTYDFILASIPECTEQTESQVDVRMQTRICFQISDDLSEPPSTSSDSRKTKTL